MISKELVRFIEQARERGFDDYKIKEILMSNGWSLYDIEQAIASIKPKYKFKNKVCIYLDSEVLGKLEHRAKKNMFTITEQIEDILRRSVINLRKNVQAEKLDDMLVTIFSRRKRKS